MYGKINVPCTIVEGKYQTPMWLKAMWGTGKLKIIMVSYWQLCSVLPDRCQIKCIYWWCHIDYIWKLGLSYGIKAGYEAIQHWEKIENRHKLLLFTEVNNYMRRWEKRNTKTNKAQLRREFVRLDVYKASKEGKLDHYLPNVFKSYSAGDNKVA